MCDDDLNDLLFSYMNASTSTERSSIEAKIWETFGSDGAIAVWDMSGFSRTSLDRGIVYYLTLVRRMQIILEPIIERYEGKVVKFEADNAFARFPTAEAALDAAIGIQIAVDAANRTTPGELDIRLSCGIDIGRFLLVHDRDFFGIAVNNACKLGEDIARAGEILITERAFQLIPSRERFKSTEDQVKISGVVFDLQRIEAD